MVSGSELKLVVILVKRRKFPEHTFKNNREKNMCIIPALFDKINFIFKNVVTNVVCIL